MSDTNMEHNPFKLKYCPKVQKLCIQGNCVAFECIEGSFSTTNKPTRYYYRCKHFDIPLGFKAIP